MAALTACMGDGEGDAGTPAPPIDFAALLAAPVWLGWPSGEQEKLARAVALGAIGSRLARSIDGNWLGALAEVGGDEALDWAIHRHQQSGDGADEASATVADDHPLEPTVAALNDSGFAMLAAALPSTLTAYLPRTTGSCSSPPEQVATLVSDAAAFVGRRAEVAR